MAEICQPINKSLVKCKIGSLKMLHPVTVDNQSHNNSVICHEYAFQLSVPDLFIYLLSPTCFGNQMAIIGETHELLKGH
jgi:hypothetical protein